MLIVRMLKGTSRGLGLLLLVPAIILALPGMMLTVLGENKYERRE